MTIIKSNDIMKKIFACIILLAGALCSCTDRIRFEAPYFVCFMPEESSSTIINAQGTVTGTYKVHLSTVKPDNTIVVKWDVFPGNGMKEGVDYSIESASKSLQFYSGVYDREIKIKWLKHDIDPAKDNTVTISLTECSQPDILLGMPGPSKKNKDIVITKYSD